MTGLRFVAIAIGMSFFGQSAVAASWAVTRDSSADWGAYMKKARGVSTYLGGSLGRTLETWGPAKLADLTSP